MAQILFTFLGAAMDFSERGGSYQSGTYLFPDGSLSHRTNYFASALLDHLRGADSPPDRIVILGTAGSMWDAVARDFARPEGSPLDLPENDITRLTKAALAENVTNASLESLAAVLRKRTNIAIDLRIIPYCRTDAEAMEVAQLLGHEVRQGDDVMLDVTHGFRHLPMLSLTAAAIIEAVNDASVSAIWYGAHEMKPRHLKPAERDATPATVLRLDGYLELLRWVRALAVFQTTGDLRGLKEPLPGNLGGLLADGGFHEQLLQTEQARKKFIAARAAMGELKGVGAMFRPALEQRLDWIEQKSAWRRQLALARQHRDNGDLTLAVLLLFEAAITRHVEISPRGNPDNYKHRETAKNDLADGAGYADFRSAFCDLRRLRNYMGHAGGGENPRAAAMLKSPATLKEAFRNFDGDLFGTDVAWPPSAF